MNAFKTRLKQVLPPAVVHSLGDARDSIARLKELPDATFNPLRRDTVSRLSKLKDQYRGQRCFIIGNGPSLRNTDMSKLRHEYTIGMNRIYLMFPELGFSTTFFLSVNDLVIEQCASDIQQLTVPKFVSWRSRGVLKPAEDLYFLYTTYTGPKFARDVRQRVWEGATVTYVALQLAFYMGFQKVILIGVDHNFVTQGKPNTTVTSQGDDPNHFAPGYFGKGFRWQLPDLDTSERSYAMARKGYESAGRQVVDATVGGKLTVFPKVDYNSLF